MDLVWLRLQILIFAMEGLVASLFQLDGFMKRINTLRAW
ncbi:hypothetical protein EV13_1693 [Prochlorococcus sp. MIT 0702]|nr:hypothetical protein EV12_2223 [Prochlorococcus sp. MIT 0701]KGG28035.1 hypothetical protein EV13_1693 [Prochlorococcus sp. MIT 0702]KGG33662.1 hypothetical protein EV14_1613 [Prochlorococcus sp. MIT 0703]